MSRPVVVFTRGGLPESEHAVAWCATNNAGEVVGAGTPQDAELAVFPRSATKPFQVLPAVRAGLLERLGLGDRHLAIACASHGGDRPHLQAVREILAAAGLSEADLGCGPLAPRDPASAAAMHARGEQPSRIVHNCSGKHAMALALAADQGWGVTGYLDAEHPLQAAMHDAIAASAGCEPDDVPHGTDGCGMQAHHLPLAALARAFGRLAGGGLGEEGERVARAMRAHPELVAFPGAPDTELMAACDGVVAKIGAEGVIAIGTADGRAVAIKVLDGAMRALDPAAVAAARGILGIEADSKALDLLARPVVLNSREEIVGEGEALL